MCYNIMQHSLVGATNIGSTDCSALTMRYSRNSLCCMSDVCQHGLVGATNSQHLLFQTAKVRLNFRFGSAD
jgi:hypothetical protein